MKKSENEKLNMLLAVSLVTNSNSLVWENMEGFVNAFNKFTGYIDSARKESATAEKKTKGVTENKKQTRISAKDAAMRVKGAVQAYASANGDIQLFESVNFGKSKITKGKSSSSHACCMVIYNAAEKILSELSTFGIDETVMQNFKDKIDAFNLLISAPRDAIAGRSVANERFTKFINLANDTLNNELVNLMENFRFTAPQFYAQFFADKRINHNATNYTEIKSEIINADTKQPLYGVLVTITSPAKTYTVTSDAYGTADKKQMRPSQYIITFSKPGFLPQSFPLTIRLSEVKTFAVKLVPVS